MSGVIHETKRRSHSIETSLAKERDEIMRGDYIPRLKRDEIRNLVRNLTKEHCEIALFSFFLLFIDLSHIVGDVSLAKHERLEAAV